jgi:DNA-binding LacI/PurR family transcriptional regulator
VQPRILTWKLPRVRQPTIIDIAARAGVSKSTVSLVLRGATTVSEATRRTVLDVIAELDYRPNAMARGLVQRRTHVIGVMLSDLHNPFFVDVLDGVDARAEEAGYRTLLATGHRSPAREANAIESLLELRTEGLILAGPRLEDAQIVEASRTAPVVLVSRRVHAEQVDCVMNDDSAGASAAVDYLVSLGHRRIAHIDGGSGASAPMRRSGYEQAMRRHGIADFIRTVEGDYTEAGGAAAVEVLLAAGTPPTAIFAANDLSALGALDALEQAGLRVPEDMSVVGYDNTSLARLRKIGLTTVDQPRREMGRAAAELLLERLEGERRTPREIVLSMSPPLVVRKSTAFVASRP